MGTLQQCALWSGGSLRRGKQVMRSRPIGGEIRRIWPGHISVTNWRLGSVNPGCGHVGLATRSCLGNFFSCAFFNVSAPLIQCWSWQCSVCLYSCPRDLHVHILAQNSTPSLPVLPTVLHSVCVTSASSYPSSDNVDRIYLNVFTPFTVSSCKWIGPYVQEKM